MKTDQTLARPVEDHSALIARIEYILDPARDTQDRMVSRAHLTNHDLRTCLAALRSQPSPQREEIAESAKCPCCGAPCSTEQTPPTAVVCEDENGDYYTESRSGLKTYRYAPSAPVEPGQC